MIPARHLERRPQARSLFDRAILTRAVRDSFLKLDPRLQAKNPVMFIVLIGAVVTTLFFFRDLVGNGAFKLNL
jgi:K+-transporting ATPase ATPase B chain